MIKEVHLTQPSSKKILIPCSHHYIVAVSFAWKQLMKKQEEYQTVRQTERRQK